MTRPADEELEAMAERLDVDDPWCQPLYHEAAALLRACKGRVKVKPLEWDDRGGGVNPQFKAATGFGVYYIERNKAGLFDWWTPASRGKIEVRTLEAAKAAAQADYETRILAAIEEPGHE